ncbi:MAG: DUF4097 family beta strand repeat-containing protein [Bdellovibrio sp.]
MNLFTKFFIAFLIWTIAFLSLGGYASNKAFQQDPDILSKIEDKYHVAIHIGGISKKNTPSNYEQANDSWKLAPPAKKIVLKVVSSDISIKKSAGSEIVITANGLLDKSKSDQLLETKISSDELVISEPDNEAVRKVSIQVELPASYTQALDIIAVNGDIAAEGLTLNDLSVKTVSGNVTFNNLNAKSWSLHSVSGDIKADSSSFTKISGKTVSGEIEITNQIPAQIDFTSVSGDVKMKLAKTDNIFFNLKSLSGSINNKHGSNRKGDFEVNVSTASGDIEIE